MNIIIARTPQTTLQVVKTQFQGDIYNSSSSEQHRFREKFKSRMGDQPVFIYLPKRTQVHVLVILNNLSDCVVRPPTLIVCVYSLVCENGSLQCEHVWILWGRAVVWWMIFSEAANFSGSGFSRLATHIVFDSLSFLIWVSSCTISTARGRRARSNIQEFQKSRGSDTARQLMEKGHRRRPVIRFHK